MDTKQDNKLQGNYFLPSSSSGLILGLWLQIFKLPRELLNLKKPPE